MQNAKIEMKSFDLIFVFFQSSNALKTILPREYLTKTNCTSTMKTSTKMYLSIFLSTACILFYQYQLSKANLLSSGNVDHIDNEVSNNLRHTTIPSSSTTTTSLPLISTTEKTVNTFMIQDYTTNYIGYCNFVLFSYFVFI